MNSIGARVAGMGFGRIFLTLFGAFWAGIALSDAPRLDLLAGVVLPTLLLLLPSIRLLRAGRRRRAEEAQPSPEAQAAGRRIGRIFGLVFGAEFALIAVAANILSATSHADYIPAAVGLIVGLHFLPLARLFRYSLYYKTGAIASGFCIAMLWLARSRPDPAAITTGLAMAVILWVTVFIVWRDARRLLAEA